MWAQFRSNPSYRRISRITYLARYKHIHASNTLPTDKGGLSGKILQPYTLKITEYIKDKYPEVEVIAGGGITTPEDAKTYYNAGADHISLGSVCFTPWKIKKILETT